MDSLIQGQESVTTKLGVINSDVFFENSIPINTCFIIEPRNVPDRVIN